jgi:hypothetical protein
VVVSRRAAFFVVGLDWPLAADSARASVRAALYSPDSFRSLAGWIPRTRIRDRARSQLAGVAGAVRDIPIANVSSVGRHTITRCSFSAQNGARLHRHAWSHGLDCSPLREVESILHGDPEWRALCEELGVRYLIWGVEEKENIPDSSQPWWESARLVAHGDWGELYDLTRSASRACARAAGSPQ